MVLKISSSQKIGNKVRLIEYFYFFLIQSIAPKGIIQLYISENKYLLTFLCLFKSNKIQIFIKSFIYLDKKPKQHTILPTLNLNLDVTTLVFDKNFPMEMKHKQVQVSSLENHCLNNIFLSKGNEVQTYSA